MANDHGEPGHTHGADECEASGKYTEYISSHLEALKAKCESFTACINELLKDENPLLVLKGEDISLNKTCGLVYKTGGDADYYTLVDKCTPQARLDIRRDIEHHLKDAVSDDRGWVRVKRCLSNKYGDKERTTFVDDVCKLASKEKEICGNYNAHKKVESFFNEQIQHLKCTCASLKHSDDHSHDVPMAAVAGAVIGGILFIVLAALAFWCYMRRKAKKKKKSPNVIYLPAPNGDNHPVYQEVFDDRPYQAHGFSMNPSAQPPTLPMRYTSHPTRAGQEEPAYLEPVEVESNRGSFRPALPRPRGQPTSNPNYDAPPEYSERDTKKGPASPDEPRYFQPLPTPPHSPPPAIPDDPAYDKLQDVLRDKEVREPPEGYASVEEARSSVPLEEAPRPVLSTTDDETAEPEEESQGEEEYTTPLGPTPAARTKKSDRQTESHYFLLEEGSQKKHSEV